MSTNPRTRAAIYARQSVNEPEGMSRQIEACTALAVARDYEVVEVYEDNAVSGYASRGDGTAFARLLADARAGRFDILIVRKLDRLGRSLSALEALTSARVRTVTTDGEVDLTTVNGRLMANVLTSVARAESETKAERRTFANADRRQRGVPTSGRVPYGYRWVTTAERAERGITQAYELDEQRADDVRRLFDSFLAGVPIRSIARDFAAEGKRTLPTKSLPEGAAFRPTTLRRMLASPYYAALLPLPRAGERYDQDAITRADCVEGDWPAIVTPEEWETSKAMLAHPERKTSPGPARRWLLSGLALCGVCREPIRAGGGAKGVHSYRCRTMAHFMRRGDPLDDFIERLVVARLSAPDVADLLVHRDGVDVAAVDVEVARIDAAIASLGNERDDGDIGAVEYARRRKRLDARRAEHSERRRSSVEVSALSAVVGEADVAAAWRAQPLGTRRAILDALCVVVVHSVGQGNRRNMSDAALARTVDIEWRA